MLSVIIMVTVAVTFLTLDVQSTMVSDHLAYKIVNVFSARASIVDNNNMFFTTATTACGVLPYIALGATAGVETLSVPARDDSISEAIDADFPIGYSIEPFVYVCAHPFEACENDNMPTGGNKRILYIRWIHRILSISLQ